MLKNYVNGADYFVSGKFETRAYFFSAVTNTSKTVAFINFYQSICDFSSQYQKKASYNQIAKFSFSNFLSILDHCLTYAIEHPLQTLSLMLYAQVAYTQAARPFLPKNDSRLAAYFPLDDSNALDETDKGNDGIIWGAFGTSNRFDEPNSAMHFNGNSYIVGPADHLPTNDRTVCFWMRPDIYAPSPETDRGGVLFGYGAGCGRSWNMVLNSLTSTPNNYVFNTSCSSGQLVYVDNSLHGSPSYWTHFAVTADYFNNGGLKMYINGTLVAANTDISIRDTNIDHTQFRIASLPHQEVGVVPYNFKGDIDDVIIYNYALSPNELKNLFEEQSQKPMRNSQNNDDEELFWRKILTPTIMISSTLVGFLISLCISNKMSSKCSHSQKKKSTNCSSNINTLYHRPAQSNHSETEITEREMSPSSSGPEQDQRNKGKEKKSDEENIFASSDHDKEELLSKEDRKSRSVF